MSATEATAHSRLAVIELVLYVVAVLIQEQRHDLLRDILMSDYLEEHHSEQRLVEFGFLQQDVRWFEQNYNDASSTHWISPTGEWLKGRANLDSVTWKEVMQADALLHLQTQVRRLGARDRVQDWYRMSSWFAQTGPYWGYQGKFTLFLKLAS